MTVSKPLSVSPDGLRSAMTGIGGSKEDLAGAIEAFKSEVAALGDPFGGDMIGMIIGTAHQVCMDVAAECFDSALGAVDYCTEKLGSMADSYETTENDIIASFAPFQLGG
ncbi:hypothetical protein AB0I28_27275 [Phytomonospora sp. NPDC050363]|uniref:WXG100 family type VII secretion target n=1 Tax=Phytomonospora sp. NPDC050363 TaxID=3155642 RepID=UPI00340C93CD